MSRKDDGVWIQGDGSSGYGNISNDVWHYNRWNYTTYIYFHEAERWFKIRTPRTDGEVVSHFPDEITTLEEMKAYSQTIWRMS